MTTLALGPQWLDANYLIEQFGLIGVLAIVFAESGLLIGFFLPGDSLLFTTGLLVTTNQIDKPLWMVCTLVGAAAILGDQAGYLFGRKVGPSLFKRPDSRLFKQENVEKAHEFFEKYGPKSLVLARFVPVIRTFTPIIAGVSRMNYRSFLTFNIIGGLLWGVGVTLLGASLGKIEFVHQRIEMMLVAIVLISVVPIAIEFLRARSKAKKAAAQAPAAPAAPAPMAGGYGGHQGGFGADQSGYGGNQGGFGGNQGGYGGGDAGYGGGQDSGYGGQGNGGGYYGGAGAGYGGQGGHGGGYGNQGGYGNGGNGGNAGGHGQGGYGGGHGAGYGNQGGYDNGGYNPGNGGYNPNGGGHNPGNGGHNPGHGGYNPNGGGHNPGHGGYNPGNGGYSPDDEGGYNPDDQQPPGPRGRHARR
ncbi:DedA family protein [Streptomyces triculaminicus]|uniref:DedA family protein n=1 Tax=Streptomyces triculaminicus TaxID=2816232 RepID=UPI0037D50AEB